MISFILWIYSMETEQIWCKIIKIFQSNLKHTRSSIHPSIYSSILPSVRPFIHTCSRSVHTVTSEVHCRCPGTLDTWAGLPETVSSADGPCPHCSSTQGHTLKTNNTPPQKNYYDCSKSKSKYCRRWTVIMAVVLEAVAVAVGLPVLVFL